MRGSPNAVAVLLALASAIAPAEGRAAVVRPFAPVPAGAGRAAGRGALPGTALVNLDRAAYQTLRSATGGQRVEVPLPDGSSLSLAVERFDLLTPDAILTTTDERGPHPLEVDAVVLKGGVEAVPGSIAVLTLAGGTVYGAIVAGSARYGIAPGGAAGEHVVADERITGAGPRHFACPSDELDAASRPGGGSSMPPARSADDARAARPEAPFPSPTRLECTIAVDCDYELYANKFGANVTACTAYMMTLYATATAVYERDVNTQLKVGFFNVWQVSSDPYTATNLQDQLSQFRGYWWANHSEVSRHLAQLASGRSLGGGVAYLNGLCNVNNGFAVYQLDAVYGFPTNSTTWDAMVLTHETGHNFGSEHTQSCYWQELGYAPSGALLDSCVAGEGTCYTGPVGILPPDRGTIMSYCHLVGGIGGTRLEFHEACKKVLRIGAESSCLPAAAIQPPREAVATLTGGGAAINWNPSPTAGVIGYDVYRSSFMLDPSPALIGSTTGLVWVDPGPGAYFYKVRAVRAADQSSFSREVTAVPCTPGTGKSYVVGNSPVALVAGDFYEDGVQDLAVANAGGNSVSILVAQRCALCNNAFGNQVSYPVGSSPAAIVKADLNEDGVLDLVVSNGGGSTISVLLGHGAAGFGDGTFAAAAGYAVGTGPAGLAAGDYDEDGITDLAVACGDGSLAILRGQGTDGVGDGTLGAATLLTLGSPGHDVVSGDFNDDGILDLAVACDEGAEVRLGQGSAGLGDGTFGPAASYGAGTGPTGLVTADLDQDGVLDLAVANAGSGDVTVLLGAGDGSFGAGASNPAVATPNRLSAGDWNADGIEDIAVAGGGSAALLWGVGDGTLGSPQVVSGGGAVPRGITAMEMTDDSRTDLVVTDALASGRVAVIPMSCAGPWPRTLQVTNPNGGGGQTLTYPGEYLVTWTKGAGVPAVDVELSRDGGTSWETLARHQIGTSFRWNVTPPLTTQGRLRVVDPTVPGRRDQSDGGFAIIPLEALAVGPGKEGLRLAVGPNPARGEVAAWLTLAESGPARLSLLDLAGRTVASREVSGGPGPRRVVLAPAASLPSGLYLVRLAQGPRSTTARLVVLR